MSAMTSPEHIHLYATKPERGSSFGAQYIGGFIDGIADFTHRLYEEMAKVRQFDRRQSSAYRTHSRRYQAGSRPNKHNANHRARMTRGSDIYSGYDTIGDWACPPNHAARFTDIRDSFPLAPGATDNLIKRWG
jgi:hypothetical protein